MEKVDMTIARFRAPLRDSQRFAAILQRARHQPFGENLIRNGSLVKNDWYMTREILETVKRWRLSGTGSRPSSAR